MNYDLNYGGTAASWGGGYLILSAVTPEGLQCALWIYLTGASGATNSAAVYYKVVPVALNVDVYAIPTAAIVPAVSMRVKLFANRFCFWVHQYNATMFQRYAPPFGGVLSLCPQLEAPIVTAATCTVPIQITTDRPHGLANGSQVFIDGTQGNTAANGLWFATLVDDYNYTLNNSDGSGMPDYMANSARAANTLTQLSRCILWYAGGNDYNNGSPRTGRTDGLFVGNGCYYMNQTANLQTGMGGHL